MLQDMPTHDDGQQDIDMIAQVLRQVADEMEAHEAGRLAPHLMKPKAAAVDVHAAAMPMEGSPEEEASETPDAESKELDPEILSHLMSKADEADSDGSLPEDKESDLDPEIANLIRSRKGK